MSKGKRQTNNTEWMPSSYTSLVPAVEQAAKILFFLARGPMFKMRLTDICDGVGIHKSKGYSILNTLRTFALVERNPQTKTYSLGPGLIFLARKVLDNIDVRDTVTPFLERLAKETRSTALFGLIFDESVFVVAKRDGDLNSGFTIQVGHKFPLTSGAHGKAIVSFLPERERAKILKLKKHYFHGDPSRLDMKRLRHEIVRCQKEGFARDVGEVQPGINAVSAPVFGPVGKIVGALILIGTFLESVIEDHGRSVADTARQISQKLGADIEHVYKQAFG